MKERYTKRKVEEGTGRRDGYIKNVKTVKKIGSRRQKAHKEIEYIFRELLPRNDLKVREEQLRLSHEMLDALWGRQVALCDAGVGIGKTYAYLVACIMMEKYGGRLGTVTGHRNQPTVISTSGIALQEALTREYIPFLSKLLLEEKLIRVPLKAVVRKGKEHFVCDNRLKLRIAAISDKKKNEEQRSALLALRTCYDMDQVHGLSGFDQRLVCVPRFCPKNCLERATCRYRNYMEQAKNADIHFQICNHNYLLADASHRAKDYWPLFSDYRVLVIDEAHKLAEAAGQMCGKTLYYEDILEICYFMEKEHQGIRAGRIKAVMKKLFDAVAENQVLSERDDSFYEQKIAFRQTGECVSILKESASLVFETIRRCGKRIPRWLRNRLEEALQILCCFLSPDKRCVSYLERDREGLPIFCVMSREIPQYLQEMLWNRGIPAVLTSGTLKARNSFMRNRQMIGLSEAAIGKRVKVQEYTADSPFEYQRNCLIYLPKGGRKVRRGSEMEIVGIADQIKRLVAATQGHTLVLFTSYSLMGNVCKILRNCLSFPMIEVWRHTQEEIHRFKEQENAVLFAAGSCWEGMDFPGDMVSSLIIVKLPFAVPDPVSEAEREEYESLGKYMEESVVPDMQKKLRQGFGRAIRTETDTCVVSILDHRAAKGGRYHEKVLQSLPVCQTAESLEDVEAFIRSRKNVEYYM
ncbi:MAG: ATP-dependent DNA helicase [Dorea sp.]|nr:ATP-dependent DNA helicase [Dorea sp.]